MASTESPRDDRVTFAEAFDDAPVGMALVEIDSRTGGLGRFLAVNRALCALGGYARGELLAVGASSVISPDDREDAALLLKRLRDGQVSSFEAEQRLSRADGSTTCVAVTTSLVGGAPGYRCALAHIQDITGRKTAEAALRAGSSSYHVVGRGHEPTAAPGACLTCSDRWDHAGPTIARSARAVVGSRRSRVSTIRSWFGGWSRSIAIRAGAAIWIAR